MNTLFKTKEDVQSAISNYKQLLNTSGWQLFVRTLEANIEVVTEQILDRPKDATEEEIDRLRSNLKLMREIKDTPKIMIDRLSQSDDMIEFDPYEEVEENLRNK